MNQAPLPAGSLASQSAIDAPPAFADMLPIAVYACDAKGRLRWFNRKAAELWGREPRIGDDTELFCGSYRLWTLDGHSIGRGQTPMAHVLETGERVDGVEAVVERPDGSRIMAMVHVDPVKDQEGWIVGAINCFHETTEIHRAKEAAEEQHRMLLAELNHRVKNNMQMLQSLLMTAQRETESREARELLADAGRRIGVMAAAQNAMYAENALRFEVRPFLEALGRTVSQSWGRQADIAITSDLGDLPNDAAVPLALIFNELVSNSVKHGRGDRNHVSVDVRLVRDGESWVLTVADDGPGFVLEQSRRRASGLGIVTGLARQLGGALDVSADGGARCMVRFPNR